MQKNSKDLFMVGRNLGLKELVNLEEWQKIQDSFAEAIEVTLRTISLNGKFSPRVSRPNHLCHRISPKSPLYDSCCGHCILKQDITKLKEIEEEANFRCFFGLDLFVLPITAVGNRILAYMVVGPIILNRRKSSSEYAKYAERLSIKLEDLMDALVEIDVFSYNKIYSINKLLRHNFSYIAQTAYHKKRLGEMAPEIREMDPLFLRYHEEKILNSMLKVCILSLDADSGSVMTTDKETNMLHIKAASKLDEDVMRNTRIKVGEGIAGMAAATAEPIILPDDKAKNGLSEKMKRSYIKSSMIVPFPKGKNSHAPGVINLNMVRKNIDFSKKDITLVQELLNLVSTALIPFQNNNSK